MIRFRIVFCWFVMFAAAGCQTMRSQEAPADSAEVHHIVICWLKEPGNAEVRRKLIEATESFRAIPGVTNVRIGTALADPSGRPQVDSSFDLAIVMTFADEQALRDYGKHPLHQQAVENVLKPLVDKHVIYDFTDSATGRTAMDDADGQEVLYGSEPTSQDVFRPFVGIQKDNIYISDPPPESVLINEEDVKP